MPRPTESAGISFRVAIDSAKEAVRLFHKAESPEKILLAQKKQSEALWMISEGLQDLTVALRATYMFLEEMKASQSKR